MPLQSVPSHQKEAEITLIGTGGYGESVLICLGNDHWIIVDSCIDPTSKNVLPLEYLKELKVNIKEAVKLIICTHWHDDHIQGISRIFEECENADLSFSKAHDVSKFYAFLSFDHNKTKIEPANSSTIEFNACLKILAKRKRSILAALENRILITNTFSELTTQLISLSPSDYTMEKFDHEISSLFKDYASPSKKIPIDSPNAKSVVLYVKLGSHRAILGADMEVSSDVRCGWLKILSNRAGIDMKASLFKISHHGSENGYHKGIFEDLLTQNPVSKLTSYNKGFGLPDPEMLKVYCDHSDKVYMTSPHISKKAKTRDKQIEKIIKGLNIRLEEIKYKKGVIRCRINMEDPQSRWSVELLENALHVNQVSLD